MTALSTWCISCSLKSWKRSSRSALGDASSVLAPTQPAPPLQSGIHRDCSQHVTSEPGQRPPEALCHSPQVVFGCHEWGHEKQVISRIAVDTAGARVHDHSLFEAIGRGTCRDPGLWCKGELGRPVGYELHAGEEAQASDVSDDRKPFEVFPDLVKETMLQACDSFDQPIALQDLDNGSADRSSERRAAKPPRGA